jgi:hypothetical protein
VVGAFEEIYPAVKRTLEHMRPRIVARDAAQESVATAEPEKDTERIG